MTPSDQLDSLIDKLGTKLVAFMVGRDVTTVSRWTNGKVPDQLDVHKVLMAAYQVMELLDAVEAAPTVRQWFIGMNPQLDDESPTEAIREGRHREVMAAARAFVAGG